MEVKFIYTKFDNDVNKIPVVPGSLIITADGTLYTDCAYNSKRTKISSFEICNDMPTEPGVIGKLYFVRNLEKLFVYDNYNYKEFKVNYDSVNGAPVVIQELSEGEGGENSIPSEVLVKKIINLLQNQIDELRNQLPQQYGSILEFPTIGDTRKLYLNLKENITYIYREDLKNYTPFNTNAYDIEIIHGGDSTDNLKIERGK